MARWNSASRSSSRRRRVEESGRSSSLPAATGAADLGGASEGSRSQDRRCRYRGLPNASLRPEAPTGARGWATPCACPQAVTGGSMGWAAAADSPTVGGPRPLVASEVSKPGATVDAPSSRCRCFESSIASTSVMGKAQDDTPATPSLLPASGGSTLDSIGQWQPLPSANGGPETPEGKQASPAVTPVRPKRGTADRADAESGRGPGPGADLGRAVLLNIGGRVPAVCGRGVRATLAMG